MALEQKITYCLSNATGDIIDSSDKRSGFDEQTEYRTEDGRYIPRSIHDLDTGKRHFESHDASREQSNILHMGSTPDTRDCYFYSAKGDRIEDVIETIEDNLLSRTEEMHYAGSNNPKADISLEQSYNSRTSEFLVHIGEITYPLDIVALEKYGGSESSGTIYDDDRSYKTTSPPEFRGDADSETYINSISNQGSPYKDNSNTDHYDDTYHNSLKRLDDTSVGQCRRNDYTETKIRSDFQCQRFQTITLDQTWQQTPTWGEYLYQHNSMDYASGGYYCDISQEYPLVDSLIRNCTNKEIGENSEHFYQYGQPTTTNTIKACPCMYSEDNLAQERLLTVKCETNNNTKQENKMQHVFSNNSTAFMAAETRDYMDSNNMYRNVGMQSECHTPSVRAPHPLTSVRYSDGDKSFQDCDDSGTCMGANTTSKQCTPGPGCVKKMKRGCRLWEFIRNLLLDPATNPTMIKWENRDKGTFKLVQSKAIAHIWGMKKGNEGMNYEKLSRAMRYYYKRQIFAPVLGKRLIYSFGPRSTGWRLSEL